MGKGGGGGGGTPTQTTAYQTNLPEYAKPYVMNMLGAAQNQLFTTSGGDITGFRPYTPYSTDPTQYFAAPSSLQQSVYNEAGRMQTPGQYAPATGLAAISGMGQLGAGQQYAQQATSPSAIGAYMSPYQQAVTDVAKMNAVREAQIAGQQANLGAARQGTYGGARQALAQSERERNLLSNLSNIQAQGSQAAYDKAIQNMQYGANLGLQGLSGAGQAASTLAGLGTAQQQADLARMGFQQQTGAAQQAYQQNIINQAIQDYATAQQYPYMQLSTMSNLLRGLPMQSMSTQQYQAQPSTTQQLLGLAGTGASLYGAFKRAGGEIKEYKAGGAVVPGYKSGVLARVDNTLDDLADAGGIGALKKRLAETTSPKLREEIEDKISELSGIASANTGKLGTNMAGGGIIAFEDGGEVQHFYNQGSVKDEDNPYGYTGFGEVAPYDPRTAIGAQFAPFERLGNAIYGFGFKTKHQIQEEIKAREKAAKAGKETDSDYQAFDAATAALEKERANKGSGAPAAPVSAASEYGSPTGLAAVLAERKKLLGLEGPGEKNEALMKALEERQAGMGKERETDRYLRMAEAFSKFGTTAGPMMKGASEALGGFAKGEALARKEEDKIKLEGMKMQADLEKARRAEARGDLDKAEDFYSKAEDRKNRIEVAQIGASSAGQSTQLEREAIDRFMADNPGMTYAQAYQAVKGAGRQESVELQGAKASLEYIKNRLTFLDPKKDAEEIKKLKAAEAQILGQLNKSGGTSGGGKPSVTNW